LKVTYKEIQQATNENGFIIKAQEAGSRKQEVGSRKQEAGSRKQEAGSRKQEELKTMQTHVLQ
jgi:hypothetical protein